MYRNFQDPILVGVLNVTPDSFSDGGKYVAADTAIEQAGKLIKEGAKIIDIGGDSTRPGSVCVGPEREWERISEVVTQIAKFCAVSVDTHHAKVAGRAIESGAAYINDISAGFDCDMFRTVAGTTCRIILTYSSCSRPHIFDLSIQGDLIKHISEFLMDRVNQALKFGVKESQIILDPGMGAFLGPEKELSLELIRRFKELQALDLPLMLSASRKGFLKANFENDPSERDILSALCAERVAFSLQQTHKEFYLRVHNVQLHKQVFDLAAKL